MTSIEGIQQPLIKPFMLAQAKENIAPTAQKQSVSDYLIERKKYMVVNLRLMGALIKVEQYHHEIAKVWREMKKVKDATNMQYVYFKKILDVYENEKKLSQEDLAERQKIVDLHKTYLETLGQDFEISKIEAADLAKLELFRAENEDTVALAAPQIERLKVELAPGQALHKDLRNLKVRQLRVWQEILHEALKMNKFIDGLLEPKSPYRDESEGRLEREV